MQAEQNPSHDQRSLESGICRIDVEGLELQSEAGAGVQSVSDLSTKTRHVSASRRVLAPKDNS